MSNLFWGMQFRTCRIFWDFADHQSSLNPKKSYKYKSHTAITSIVVALATNLKNNPSLRGRIADSHEAIQKKNQSARSANPYLTPSLLKATKSPKYPLKSFCFVLLSQKVESPYSQTLIYQTRQILQIPRNKQSKGLRWRLWSFCQILGVRLDLVSANAQNLANLRKMHPSANYKKK